MNLKRERERETAYLPTRHPLYWWLRKEVMDVLKHLSWIELHTESVWNHIQTT